MPHSHAGFSNSSTQAQKFGFLQDDSDDELEEESLLETPLDKVEPYGLFRDTLISRYTHSWHKFVCPTAQGALLIFLSELQQDQPRLYDDLTKILNPDEQRIVQAVVLQADANAVAAHAVAAATASQQVNGGAH